LIILEVNMRCIFILICALLFSWSAVAQSPVAAEVQLLLAMNKSSYQTGEPIVLELEFTASESGYNVDTTVTEPASPIDDLVLSPKTGVYSWLDDYSRGNRYWPDYSGMSALQPGQSVKLKLPLNALYRFDQPGHYTVHVVSKRVSRGSIQALQPIGALTSNDVSFEVVPMSDSDEAAEAASLEALIRSAPDLKTAQQYAERLQWLTGDPSTRVKISLFLNPKTFYPFGVDVSQGLWLARNRDLVVSSLEQSMIDPRHAVETTSGELRLAVALKARLLSPYDASSEKQSPLATEQIEHQYLNRIAETLPQRQGDSLVGTAITLLTTLVQRKETTTVQFQAVREAIIRNFATVNEYQIDWLLNAYGKYLADERMIPALQAILRTQPAGLFPSTKAAVFRQLFSLSPASTKPFLIEEICDAKSLTHFDVLAAAPFDSLPKTDACLLNQIRQYSKGDRGTQIYLQQKAALAARFATAAIYDDLLKIYSTDGSKWGGQERGAMLAYLARYGGKSTLPLLESAMPADAPTLEPNVSFSLFRAYYSPVIDSFLRQRLNSPYARQASQAAYEMSAHGPREDQAILRKRLDAWNAKWSNHPELPQDEAMLQAELIRAVIHGLNWQLSNDEANVVKRQCQSDLCRSQLGVKD
jgi:hypothetical protein